MARIESVLLGDNPFFGVDHLSQERARQKATISQNIDNITSVMEYSSKLGMSGMVVSSRPNLSDILKHIKKTSKLIDEFNFYPIILSPTNYISKINEKGISNTLMEVLNPAGFQNKIKILAKGGLGAIRKDLFEIFKVFVDIELIQFHDARIQTVFLHDVVTDLALSLNMKDIFEEFNTYLHDKYKVKAGLVTKNFARLVNKLNSWNMNYTSIMTSFNNIGFQMNPSRTECENAILNYQGEIIAMSILAGGYLSTSDAYSYLTKLPKIKTVVVGISSIEHAKKTCEALLKDVI